jgi:hypothetical protein
VELLLQKIWPLSGDCCAIACRQWTASSCDCSLSGMFHIPCWAVVSGDRLSPLSQMGRYLVFLQYPGHPSLRYNLTICHQVLMDSLGSVLFFAGFEGRLDLWEQVHVPRLSIRFSLIPGRLEGQQAIKPASVAPSDTCKHVLPGSGQSITCSRRGIASAACKVWKPRIALCGQSLSGYASQTLPDNG